MMVVKKPLKNSLYPRHPVNEIQEYLKFYELYYISEYYFDLCMKIKGNKQITESEFKHFPKNFNLNEYTFRHFKKQFFDPRFSMEDFYSFFLKIKNSEVELTNLFVHKLINQIKIETCVNIKEKDIFSLKFVSEMANFFKISFIEKLNNEYSKLIIRSRTINSALTDILNFNVFEDQINYKNPISMFVEVNNFLDIFVHEADLINLKNELVYIAKYIQFTRNNKSRYLMYKIYEEFLREERMISYADSHTSEFDPIYNKYKELKLLIPNLEKKRF